MMTSKAFASTRRPQLTGTAPGAVLSLELERGRAAERGRMIARDLLADLDRRIAPKRSGQGQGGKKHKSK